MLKFLIGSDNLEEIVKALTVVDETIVISASPEGLDIIKSDAMEVIMVETKIHKERFREYQEKDTESIALDFGRILRFVEGVNDSGTNMEAISAEYNERDRSFKLKSKCMSTKQELDDPASVRKSVKHIDLDSEGLATIDAQDFARAISTMLKAECDYVIMGIKKTGGEHGRGLFYMENTEGEIIRMEVESGDNKHIWAQKDIESLFRIDYVNGIIETAKKSGTPEVDIALGTDMPARFSFKLPKTGATVIYTLSHREWN